MFLNFITFLFVYFLSPDARFPFSFVILVAGFCSRSSGHIPLYQSPITLPSLHVFGDTDRVIPKGKLNYYFEIHRPIQLTL